MNEFWWKSRILRQALTNSILVEEQTTELHSIADFRPWV